MSTPERDELAGIIASRIEGDTYNCTRVWEAWSYGTMSADDFEPASEDAEMMADVADAILAAGYSKPRTITTAEELDALPVGSILLDVDGDACQRFRGGWRATIDELNDDPWLTDTLEVDLPATVLYEPQPCPPPSWTTRRVTRWSPRSTPARPNRLIRWRLSRRCLTTVPGRGSQPPAGSAT